MQLVLGMFAASGLAVAPTAARPVDPAVVAGAALFKQKCTGCHAINGEGGRFGPDLGKIGSVRNRNYIAAKLRHPKKTNPSSFMPSFGDLPRDQFESLLLYLEQLR
jgi:mono/diheme cytochrome c family protein